MDTNTWTNEEVGIYLRLLISEWINGPLPNDTKKLAQIARISPKKFKNLFQICSPKFVKNGKGFLINKKLEKIREKVNKLLEQKKNAGKASAKKRWKNDNERYNGCYNGCYNERCNERCNVSKPNSLSSYTITNNKKHSNNIRNNVYSDKQPSAVQFEEKKSRHFENIIDKKIVEKINTVCKKIKSQFTDKKFNPWQFVQINCNAHPEAILYVLEQLEKQGSVIKSPWAYANKVLTIESQNYNECEAIQAHKAMKKMFQEMFPDNLRMENKINDKNR